MHTITKYYSNILGDVLPGNEIDNLFLKLRNGCTESGDKIFLANTKLVVTAAASYKYSTIDIADLVSEGNIGLLQAMDRYDSNYRANFCTYANYYIRMYIYKYVMKNKCIIRVPSTTIRKSKEITSRIKELEETKGSSLELSDIKDDELLTINNIKKASAVMNISIVHTDSITDNSFYKITKPLQGITSTKDEVYKLAISELKNLDIKLRDKKIMMDRFGIGKAKPLLLKDIAIKHNVTMERVRQIIKDVARLLRSSLMDLNIDAGHCRL